MKIQIIGYSGSGKSTLAKMLSRYYQIPLLYLDSVQFYGEWCERSIEEQNKIVETFLDDHEDWVIDGNYGKVAPRRFQECDIMIFLDYSRFYCYRMAFFRYLKNKGKSRESCPCVEKFDFAFQRWILFESRTKEYKDMHLKHLLMCSGQTYIFKNKRQLNKYLKEKGIEVNINKKR